MYVQLYVSNELLFWTTNVVSIVNSHTRLLMLQFVILGCLLCIIFGLPIFVVLALCSHIFVCRYDDLFLQLFFFSYVQLIWCLTVIVVNFVSTKLFNNIFSNFSSICYCFCCWCYFFSFVSAVTVIASSMNQVLLRLCLQFFDDDVNWAARIGMHFNVKIISNLLFDIINAIVVS